MFYVIRSTPTSVVLYRYIDSCPVAYQTVIDPWDKICRQIINAVEGRYVGYANISNNSVWFPILNMLWRELDKKVPTPTHNPKSTVREDCDEDAMGCIKQLNKEVANLQAQVNSLKDKYDAMNKETYAIGSDVISHGLQIKKLFAVFDKVKAAFK